MRFWLTAGIETLSVTCTKIDSFFFYKNPVAELNICRRPRTAQTIEGNIVISFSVVVVDVAVIVENNWFLPQPALNFIRWHFIVFRLPATPDHLPALPGLCSCVYLLMKKRGFRCHLFLFPPAPRKIDIFSCCGCDGTHFLSLTPFLFIRSSSRIFSHSFGLLVVVDRILSLFDL